MKYTVLLLSLLSFSAKASEVKPWYINLGVSTAEVNYLGETGEAVDKLNLLNPSHSAWGSDLGVYKTMSESFLLGGALTGTLDSYGVSGARVDITQAQLGASAIKYTNQIGLGFYYRGDLGVSRYSAKVVAPDVYEKGKSKLGYGALAGLGYSIKVSDGVSISLQLAATYRKTSDVSSTSGVLSAAVLF